MTSPDQQSATAIIQAQLDQWGLSTLTGTVSDLIRQGLGTDAITLQLQATPEYKTRFAANDARVKAGLAALTPAQYIATENSYRQVLTQYGLPATFYDQPSDFQAWLSGDVSPDEVKSRAQAAQQVYLSNDTGVRDVWRQWGLDDGAGIAAILDESKALPVLQNMVTAAQGGAAAVRNGLTADQGRLQQYVDQGATVSQLQQGFGQIGQSLAPDQAAAARAGMTFSQADAEAATIQGTASARRKQAQIEDSEKALFGSRAGADDTSLNRRTGGAY